MTKLPLYVIISPIPPPPPKKKGKIRLSFDVVEFIIEFDIDAL